MQTWQHPSLQSIRRRAHLLCGCAGDEGVCVRLVCHALHAATEQKTTKGAESARNDITGRAAHLLRGCAGDEGVRIRLVRHAVQHHLGALRNVQQGGHVDRQAEAVQQLRPHLALRRVACGTQRQAFQSMEVILFRDLNLTTKLACRSRITIHQRVMK